MKYFIDTEFIEGSQKGWFGRNTKPTIELISIGIVAEDHRNYYAISKEFNIKEAWNRFDIKNGNGNINMSKFRRKGFTYFTNPVPKVEFWLRDNVLKPIFRELMMGQHAISLDTCDSQFTYKNFKRLINKYGKTNKEIAKDIQTFCKPQIEFESVIDRDFYNSEDSYNDAVTRLNNNETVKMVYRANGVMTNPEFYGYYCDYDWVVFCWLFGKMINLPKGFPMYCIDLKQELDRLANVRRNKTIIETPHINVMDIDGYIKGITRDPNYPKQANEHNALSDAKWNKSLYEFLNKVSLNNPNK